jgi:hypothetical protein
MNPIDETRWSSRENSVPGFDAKSSSATLPTTIVSLKYI